ncbi:3718_t:CDS:2 [Ambispora leptoticha]|uniref:3718_t:CDS:1 n=1 Tax=Ambispora leptoticha TaxID=144679 RepID=A0A9N8Z7Q2_9GLOM|nr:3718_t:CDS:2 [Ambispora leptoticha]
MSGFSATSATYPHDEKTEDNDEEDDDRPKVVDTDPTGRFERFEESLGVGAYKEVYKAFDQEEGVEVAWCQLKLHFSKKKDAEKIQREIEILQSLRCENIINFYASWLKKGPDGKERVFFVTELMTSGTLKQYLRKTKGQLKPKVLKTWARQILKGLDYLHTREPPIIHRDLKCDNIFINGNNGQAKIGDLGLAIIKSKEHASSVLGTPEFMAPELYEEKYNEKVDIYAFGMCILELVTKEYPYTECTNQAQIYRKVTTGIKPQALQKVQDPATLEFIELCLRYNPDERPSAGELLKHEFLKEACVDQQQPRQNGGGVSSGTVPQPVTVSPPKSPILQQAGSTPVEPRSQEKTNLLSLPFTLTKTIDSENKTYQVSSATFPPSSSSTATINNNNKNEEHVRSTATTSDNQTLFRRTPMQCNVVIYEPTEKERQSNKFKPAENEVLLAMTIVVPDRTDVEIKFPFNLHDDTPEDVVAEMVREQILSQEGHDLAKKNIEDIVNKILSGEVSIPTQSMDDFEDLNGSTRGSRPPSVIRSDYDSSHETDDEFKVKLPASRSIEDLSSSFHSEISSSSENVNGMQPCFDKDMYSSLESLTRASSARTSWEREDNEVRQVLHKELTKNTATIVDSTDEPIAAKVPSLPIDTQSTLDLVGSPPSSFTTSTIANARSSQKSSRTRSASLSVLTICNGATPLSPSLARSGPTTPYQGPTTYEGSSTCTENLHQLPSELHVNDLKMPPPKNTFSRPSSVASDANGLWNNSNQPPIHNPNQILTHSQTPSIIESQNNIPPTSPNISFYNPESPRSNYGRSVSFSGSHSPSAPLTKLQDWQRRMSNPVSSSTPIQPDISSSLTNGYLINSTTNVERVRRSSVSSTTSHSSAHSATNEVVSELIVDSRAQNSQQSNSLQRQEYIQKLLISSQQKQEEITLSSDLGAGLGIQTEHGYTSKYRHGTSNSSTNSYFPLVPAVLPGATSISSSATVSPTENYPPHGLPEPQHHYQSSFGPSYETISCDDASDDEDVAAQSALRIRQERETAELQKKHANEWMQLMNERKQKYKHQSKNSGNVSKSPASSPKMNRPSIENNNTHINGLSSSTSTPSLGPQITSTSIENTAGLNGRQQTTTATYSMHSSTSSPNTLTLPSSSHSNSTKSQTSSTPLLPAAISSSHSQSSSISLPSTLTAAGAVSNNPLSASVTSKISSLSITTSQTVSPYQQQDTIPSSASVITAAVVTTAITTTNTLPPRSLTPSTLKSHPDGLIAEMSERQLAELQNSAHSQKLNGQAKSSSLVNGTATYASVVANSKTQSGRESPVDLSTSRHCSQTLIQIPNQFQSNISSNCNNNNGIKLSLNEMEKQKRLMSQNIISSSKATINNQASQTVVSASLSNALYSPVHHQQQQNHSINKRTGLGIKSHEASSSLPNKSHNQSEQDLLG